MLAVLAIVTVGSSLAVADVAGGNPVFRWTPPAGLVYKESRLYCWPTAQTVPVPVLVQTTPAPGLKYLPAHLISK